MSRGDASRSVLEDHFGSIFGERWPILRQALLQPNRHVALRNGFVDTNPFRELEAQGQELKLMIEEAHCEAFCSPSGSTLPPPRTDPASGLRQYYFLDLASVIAALNLDIYPGQRVLDMCAAPGGKTLVIAHQLFGAGDTTGQLVANDRSSDRRARLKGVLSDYLPPNVLGCCSLHGIDAVQWGRNQPERFDRVLLDAPCGSERHVLQHAASKRRDVLKDEWSPSRSKRNASLQLDLLLSAIKALRPGGRLVYSTCSISHTENDQVVEKALKRQSAMEVVHGLGHFASSLNAESTTYGKIAYPDTADGWGPLYWCVLEKRSPS